MYTSEYEALVKCADDISRTWVDADRDYEAFPSIVLELTKGLDLSYFGQLANLHRLASEPRVAALQRPSTFSDLYFKLYDDGHYWIEVLNWWTSDVNIHDHDFSGVQFQLTGRSLNVTFKFVAEDVVEGAELGRADVAEATVWQPGTSSLIIAGDGEPHSVCHLNSPTVSLLFRTHPLEGLGPQNNYFPPVLRGSYGVATIDFRTRLKILRLLARSDQATFQERFWESVNAQTFQQNLFTIVKLADLLYTRRHADLLTRFAESHVLGAETITKAVGHHRSSDHLKSIMRDRRGPQGSDAVSLAALASSWNAESLEAIERQLSAAGWNVDCEGALDRAAVDGALLSATDPSRILRRYGRAS